MKQISATGQGVVAHVMAAPGDIVDQDTVLVVTELMKMLTEHRAPSGGRIVAVHVKEGDTVETDTPMLTFEAGETGGSCQRDTPPSTGQSLIGELSARRHALSDAGRADRVARRHASGGRTARENIEDLLDDGSFSEIGGHALAAQHGLHAKAELIDRSAADGVIVGSGAIDGQPVAVLAVDYTVMAGTQGWFHHKKVDRIVELAHRRKLPLVLYPEGGGGRPNDVDAMRISIASLDVMTFHNLARLRGVAPMIAMVHGYCFAGSAAFAAVADVIIGTRRSYIGMGGPAMIEGGGLGSFAPEEIGPAEVHAQNGALDIVVEDEAAGTALAQRLIGLLTGGKAKSAQPPSDNLEDLMPQDRRTVFDIRAVISAVVDNGTAIELRAGHAAAMVTMLARIDGRPVGLLANDPGRMGGAIDGAAAAKAAVHLRLCQANGLPVVSLIDTPGFMVGPNADATGQFRPIGDFFAAGAQMTAPLVAVVLRRAYGLGAMAMAGGSLHAADLTVAWPNGEFGAMGLEGAVRLGMRDQLAAIEDETRRAEEFQRQVDSLYDKGRALNAAAFFEFDDVIKPGETRNRIIQAIAAGANTD